VKLPVKLPEMKTGLAVSAVIHAALLLWGLVSFAARPLEAAPTQGLPVDIISDTQFSELTKGQKDAKAEQPKPLVDKIGDVKAAEEATAKVSEKKEITAAAEPPPPETKPPEPKQESKPEKKPVPPKVDPISDALKKEDAKKAAEAKEAKKKAAQQKPQPPQPQFDPSQIAALLDKRQAQRTVATGEEVNPTAGVGIPNGSAAKLSQSELDAMRARLMQLWNPPSGSTNPEEMIVKIRIRLTKDGRLNGPPMVVSSGHGTIFETARDNAIRALFRGQPFDMLKPATYDLWKDIEITFDPRDMYRG
jgi:outer membrane biosynthesis protein TonB